RYKLRQLFLRIKHSITKKHLNLSVIALTKFLNIYMKMKTILLCEVSVRILWRTNCSLYSRNYIILIPFLPNESKEVLYLLFQPLLLKIYQFITLMTILGSVFNSKVMKIEKVGLYRKMFKPNFLKKDQWFVIQDQS